MSEIKIGKDIYYETVIENEVEVPGGIILKVRGLKAHVCPETGDELIEKSPETSSFRGESKGVQAFRLEVFSDVRCNV